MALCNNHLHATLNICLIHMFLNSDNEKYIQQLDVKLIYNFL